MMQFEVMFEHVVTIYGPPTVATDSGGGTTMTWPTTRASGVKCLIDAPMGVTTDRFNQPQLIGQATIAMFTTSVQRGDQIEVTTGPTMVGLKMKVTGIKIQPQVTFLGFTESIAHVQVEQLR